MAKENSAFIYVIKWKDAKSEFSEARQCANVILGVDGTAAVFFAYFFELQQKSKKNK